jgi:hypothetical protein
MSLRKDRAKAVMADKKIHGGHALVAVGTCLLGLIAYAAGCSVPDRKYVDDTGGTSNGGSGGGSAGTAHGGTGTTTGGSSANAGTTSAEGGEAGATTGGQPGMNRPVPTKGLIVVGGTAIDQTQGVISVVEPITGKRLATENLPATTQVAAIAYDGAPKKDVWYVFIAGAFPAAPDKTVELQVRYFDDVKNEWITLYKKPQYPPPVPGTLTVLNDRLAYLSHAVVAGKVTETLTVLDTSDVLAPKPIPYTLDTSVGPAVTLIGTRGTAADPKSVGGTLDVGLSENCAGTPKICELHVLPISVADSLIDGQEHLIAKYQGIPLAAAGRAVNARQKTLQDFFVLSDATGAVSLYITDPDAPEAATPTPAPQTATDLYDLTIADCQTLGIFTAQSENVLDGLTLDFGAGKTLDLGREGQLVAYEPFSGDVIATYNPPTDGFLTAPPDSGVHGPELTAVSVTSSGITNLSLPVRTKGWAPPTDIRANVITTRFPVPFTCK